MLVLIAALCLPPTADTAVPVHSHNDYWRSRPLLEAIEAGCLSIEADVLAKDGKLMVGHGPRELTAERTLSLMYLKPLAEIVRSRDRVYPKDDRALILLVDLKTDWVSTKPTLSQILNEYADVLKAPGGTHKGPGGIVVAVSGSGSDRADAPCGVDGRPSRLGGTQSIFEKPLTSQSFRSTFRWSGLGTLDNDQQKRLKRLSQRVNAEGRLLRLWAAPDTPEAWETLLKCGAGVINTDQPTKAAEFIRAMTQSGNKESPSKSKQFKEK